MSQYAKRGWTNDTSPALNQTNLGVIDDLLYLLSRRVLDVKEFGVKGDGTTDDTNAINAVIGSAAGQIIYFPPGDYKITSALLPVGVGARFMGAGAEVTKITQYTAGQPIIKYATDSTHTQEWSHMTLQYSSDQTNTASIGILWQVAGGSTNGFFWHNYHHLRIIGAYRALGVADADGQQTIWDSGFDYITVERVKNSAVWLAPAAAVGMPGLSFKHFKVQNTGGTVSTGPCFRISAVNEVVFDTCGVEGWYDTIMEVDGGGATTITGMHVEHHVIDTAFSRLFKVSNGPVTIEGSTFAGASTANNTDQACLVHLDSGSVHLKSGWHDFDLTLGAQYLIDLVEGSSAADISVQIDTDFTDHGGASDMLDPRAAGANGAYAALIVGGARALTYGTTVTPDLSKPSRYLTVDVTNGTGWTLANPTSPKVGDVFTVDIKNSSGGVMGTVTFGGGYLQNGWSAPANGKRKTGTFRAVSTSSFVQVGSWSGDL